MRANGLGNVSECVDSGASNGLLVRLEQLEQLKTDAHPLPGAHELGAAVSDATHQLNTILLHLLVAILEDGRETGQQVLDGRRHFCHADHVDDALECAEDAAEHLGILLAQVLEQHLAQVTHELLLLRGLHDHGDLGDQVGRLLTHLGRLVIQTPEDGTADLRQIGLDTLAERVDHGAEAVEHDGVVGGLLLEGVQYAVDELLLEAVVDVGGAQIIHDLLYGLHDHLAVGLGLVLEVVHDAVDDLGGAHLVGDLHCGVD